MWTQLMIPFVMASERVGEIGYFRIPGDIGGDITGIAQAETPVDLEGSAFANVSRG
jgi:hypothetical protein